MFTLFWQQLRGRKFILSCGDNGALLLFFEKNKLVSRIFAASSKEQDVAEMALLLQQYPDAPIRIYFDTLEQSCTEQFLPGVGALTVERLVQRRLKKESAKGDLRTAIRRGRSKEEKKEWRYSFAVTPMTSDVSNWIDFVYHQSNPLLGVYMMGLEAEKLLNDLTAARFSDKSEGDPPVWQFVVLHNKISGFRQVVLRDGEIIFSRLVRLTGDQSDSALSGALEHELSNTLDYVRRLSFREDEGFEMVAIVSESLKLLLEKAELQGGRSIMALTPEEVSGLLSKPLAVPKSDRYCDTLSVMYFAATKPFRRLTNAMTKTMDAMSYTAIGLYYLALFLGPALVISILVMGGTMLFQKQKIAEKETERRAVENQLQLMNESSGFDVNDASKIRDFVDLYRDLVQESVSPFSVLQDTKELNGTYKLMLSNFKWEYNYDPFLQELKSRRGASKTPDKKTAFNFTLQMFNEDSSLEGVLQNFDVVTDAVKEQFADYQITHSRLPDKIDFQSQERVIDIDVRGELKKTKK